MEALQSGEPETSGSSNEIPGWLGGLPAGEFDATGWKLLCVDQEFALIRGCLASREQSVFLRTTRAEASSVASVALLERELACAADVNPRWSARPVRLTYANRRALLWLQDPGGDSLVSHMQQLSGIEAFLRTAIAVTSALAQMHGAGLIHRDVKPANLLVDMAAGRAWFTGFANASRRTRELPSLASPQAIVGTLAYMAPEQTGRMNRLVDSRSDLYSLGVIFYEMLAGALPIDDTRTIALIHGLIARQPRSPSARAGVPEQLSRIAMKLLNKTAEGRYQTAEGLEADLQCCLDGWLAERALPQFALGLNDLPPRLLIADQLYGRQREVELLQAALARVSAQGSCEFVLVSGSSGVGKSAVVGELRRASLADEGFFLVGKFDQYKRGIPYTSIAQAVHGLCRLLLSLDECDLGLWRDSLRAALGRDAQVMINLVPDLVLVLGPQPPLADLSSQEAQVRFHNTFRRFLSVFARPERPLLLFIDDLQWLDEGTLELLTHLACHPEARNLLLIGAYRDGEVGPSHPLRLALEAMRLESKAAVSEIVLAPLGFDYVEDLVSDTLRCTRENAAPLSSVVFQSAGGNPFFTIQFLTGLADEGLLFSDPKSRAWNWDLERIRAKGRSASVLEVMVARLGRLEEGSKRILAYMACLGGTVSSKLLASILDESNADDPAALSEAVDAGLIVVTDTSVKFAHDRVQEAAYELIAERDRPRHHLVVGRKLLALTPAEMPGDRIFDVVNQFRHAAALIDDPEERRRVAALYVSAGKRAKAATAYQAAAEYLRSGWALLTADIWNSDFTLAFELDLELAECEFLTGELGAAEARLADLAEKCRDLKYLASVTWLQVTLQTAMDRSDLAIELCLGYMRRTGVDWSAHPTKQAARAEYGLLLERLGNRPIDSLRHLPHLVDGPQRATLDLLTAVLPPAFFSDENLVCLILCRMANMSLEHGNSNASPLAYAYLGMVVGPHFDDYRSAFQFGTVGLELVETSGLDRYRARVYLTFGAHVLPWARHLRDAPPLLRRAIATAAEVGDITYGGFASCTLIASRYAGGDPLDSLEAEADARLAFVQKARFGLIIDIILTQRQLVRSLRGSLPHFGVFDDRSFNERAFEEHLAANKSLAIAECWYWIRKSQARYFARDTAGAASALLRAGPMIWTSSGHLECAGYHFFGALSHAAAHDDAEPQRQALHMRELSAHRRQLSVWAETCPENFACRLQIIDAEIARLRDDVPATMEGYERAAESARTQGFVHIEALALELAARWYATRGLETVGLALMRSARACYVQWGAFGKVRQLEAEYPRLRDTAPASLAPPNPAFQLEHLDLETVFKTSEAVSSEVGLGNLIDTLMNIALEHSGAQRGMLILPRSGQLHVEAEATVTEDGIKVVRPGCLVTGSSVPASVIYYVLRSQRCVVIEDAREPNEFSTDDLIANGDARSVLCLPLVKQGDLIGLLYLENSLAAGVFTSDRVALLRLLASTAAVSVESATLEEKESLLKEVHHRVKNNLQLISSLLNLQAAKIADPDIAELFADSRNRVRSMALVHENLYRAGNFARVPMNGYVQNLCAQLVRAYNIQTKPIGMDLSIDDVQLDLDRAISCGLIVNELVSNAMKHAFPDGSTGHVHVELKRAENMRLVLRVWDDGVGLVDGAAAATSDSMGHQLVHDLALQLDGDVTFATGPGTTITVTFPWSGNTEQT